MDNLIVRTDKGRVEGIVLPVVQNARLAKDALDIVILQTGQHAFVEEGRGLYLLFVQTTEVLDLFSGADLNGGTADEGEG